MTRLLTKQTGQSMTQYIIILALVAVSAVTLFSAFGGVNRAQVSAVANEIAGNGQGAKDSIQLAQNYARYASDSASYSRDMGNYSSSPSWSNYSGGGSYGGGGSGTGGSGTGGSGTGGSGTGGSGTGDSGTGDSGTGGSGTGGSGTGGSGTGGSGTGGSGTGGSGTGGSGTGGSGTGGSGTGGSGTGGSGTGGTGGITVATTTTPPIVPNAEPLGIGQNASEPAVETTTNPNAITTIEGLGRAIKELINKSPTLTSHIDGLIADGWSFEYGTKTETDKGAKIIRLTESLKTNTKRTVLGIAHEVGHARDNRAEWISFAGLTKQQYIERNTLNQLEGEGTATFYSLGIRDELLNNTKTPTRAGIDIGVDGANTGRFTAIYDHYKKNEQGFDKEGSISAMARVYGNHETPNNSPNKKYFQYYRDFYLEDWNTRNNTSR